MKKYQRKNTEADLKAISNYYKRNPDKVSHMTDNELKQTYDRELANAKIFAFMQR